MTIKKIFTIGHSTRTMEQFVDILIANDIRVLVDVRSYPYSEREPQFNKNMLKQKLARFGIKYIHISELGGRRHNVSHIDTSIKIKAFSSYAAYMRTHGFKLGLVELKKIASKYRTAIMCAEALWWSCHRRMISDRLTYDGWKVYHLGLTKKPILHEVWNISRLDRDGDIVYDQ